MKKKQTSIRVPKPPKNDPKGNGHLGNLHKNRVKSGFPTIESILAEYEYGQCSRVRARARVLAQP